VSATQGDREAVSGGLRLARGGGKGAHSRRGNAASASERARASRETGGDKVAGIALQPVVDDCKGAGRPREGSAFFARGRL